MLLSVTQCYSVLLSVTKCHSVLLSVTQCYSVLISVAQCYSVLLSVTQWYSAVLSVSLHFILNYSVILYTSLYIKQCGTLILSQCSSHHFTRKINRKYRLWYNVSVPYPKPGFVEKTGNIELGVAPLIQHYSVFSAQPSLGYGTLIQCNSKLHSTLLIIPRPGHLHRGNICQCYPCRSRAIWQQTGCSIMSVSHTPN